MTTTISGIAATTPTTRPRVGVDATRRVHAAGSQLYTAAPQHWSTPIMTDLKATALIEASQPGWKVVSGKRTYIVWGPRPETDHGRTIGGTPVRSAVRTTWAGCWDSEVSTVGDFWRGDTIDEVLAPMPAEVESAFRAAVSR
jgi:hypothetical protein